MSEYIIAAFICHKTTRKYDILKHKFAAENISDYCKEQCIKGVNLLLVKTEKPVVRTVSSGNINFHFNWRKDGLIAIVVAHRNLIKSIAHFATSKLLNDFAAKISYIHWPAGNDQTIYYNIDVWSENFEKLSVEDLPKFEDSNMTLCDIYMTTLAFKFPEMTAGMKAQVKEFQNKRYKGEPILLKLKNSKIHVSQLK